MKTLVIAFLIGLSTPSFALSKSPRTLEERCEKLKEKMQMQQFKYHDTVARMTVQLRESSTPTTPIDLERVNEHIRSLKASKRAMNRLVKSKLYLRCF